MVACLIPKAFCGLLDLKNGTLVLAAISIFLNFIGGLLDAVEFKLKLYSDYFIFACFLLTCFLHVAIIIAVLGQVLVSIQYKTIVCTLYNDVSNVISYF